MTRSAASRRPGLGCAAVLGLVLVVALVAWLVLVQPRVFGAAGRGALPPNVPPVEPEDVPAVDIHAEGRTAEQLREWSEPISKDTEIPGQALRAYANAEAVAREAWPECHLRWNTLAGLGQIETRHGSYTGGLFNVGELDEEGRADPPIFGPALDGRPGFAEVPDTDGGELDGDDEYDRAMGPMQFIPETWRLFGLDANGDGVADPQQIDDAALSAAKMLCNGRDLADPEDWSDAIFGYNQSGEYLTDVRDAANAYGTRQPAP